MSKSDDEARDSRAHRSKSKSSTKLHLSRATTDQTPTTASSFKIRTTPVDESSFDLVHLCTPRPSYGPTSNHTNELPTPLELGPKKDNLEKSSFLHATIFQQASNASKDMRMYLCVVT
ncbi:hypothetical protein FI667_g14262, partial [Globisporangium splendens]